MYNNDATSDTSTYISQPVTSSSETMWARTIKDWTWDPFHKLLPVDIIWEHFLYCWKSGIKVSLSSEQYRLYEQLSICVNSSFDFHWTFSNWWTLWTVKVNSLRILLVIVYWGTSAKFVILVKWYVYTLVDPDVDADIYSSAILVF